ncbi:hypothetical protein BDV96DRAFT_132853 [Lophiotrema nucula]|uniref:Mediator of RNA polymerase II transcription subunit 11 n=1 Tax=Lophiotrema nucula TaxID=690887 RepID=A0A6A5ZS06_9PLEO|nr:hypothetical protein BDV96DRAFT_132853 [Lophiotrema nucula]
MSSSQGPAAGQSQTPYHDTAAKNIRDLARINEEVRPLSSLIYAEHGLIWFQNLPQLLELTATALSQLTNRPIPVSSTSTSATDSTLVRERAFLQKSDELFRLINITRDALKSNVDRLTENDVIPKETTREVIANRPAGGQPQQAPAPQAVVTNGGLGEFDIGMLNARARVGREGEAVMRRVEKLLEGIVNREKKDEDSTMADG